jgi:hypothetical protein
MQTQMTIAYCPKTSKETKYIVYSSPRHILLTVIDKESTAACMPIMNISSSNKPSPLSRITLLMQLETYANSTSTTTDAPAAGGREEGGKALKSCFLQLTKARQSKAKGALTVESAFLASNVREEFRARTRVMMIMSSSNKVPLLLDEDDDETANVGTTTTATFLSVDAPQPPTFVLYDTVEEYRKVKNADMNDDDTTVMLSKTTTTTNTTIKDGGLRQRKNKSKSEDKENQKNSNEGISSSSSWELVDELDANHNNTNTDLADDEVLQDFQVGPLELLGGGFPPRELRRAQEEAQKALTSYVQAANAAAVLLHSLRQAATSSTTITTK